MATSSLLLPDQGRPEAGKSDIFGVHATLGLRRASRRDGRRERAGQASRSAT
jgi:hypothetical protein